MMTVCTNAIELACIRFCHLLHLRYAIIASSFPPSLMSCCSGGSTTPCPCGPQCPANYVGWLPRIAYGLILVGYGVSHYRNLSGFVGMAKGVFPTVVILAKIAGVLAYIVPALMIIGGILFAIKQLCCLSKACILASLSGIIGWASLAVLVGDGNAAGAMMPMIQNASVLLILYYMIKKASCCKGPSCGTSSCSMPK